MAIHKVDFLILGSGSTAFAAAIKASELDSRVLMVEERTVGGTCVNRGCVPSKNLIEAAHLWHLAGHPRFPGVHTRQEHLDLHALIAQKDEVVLDLRQKKYLSIADKDAHLQVWKGHAQFVDPHTVEVDGEPVMASQILIATGSRPILPPIPGLNEVDALTSDLLGADDRGKLTELPPSLAIIGGGYIAVELGQMFARFGSQVTIIEMLDRILPTYEPEIGLALQSILREEGIAIHTSTRVERVERSARGVVLHTTRGQFEACRLLVAVGRCPNTDQLNLKAAGVETDPQGFVKVDEYLRTNVPHIWAAGDVVNGQMATPVGAHAGALVARNAFGKAMQPMDYTVIPRAVFTDPQVGVVGLTDEEANQQGYRCQCRVVSLEHVPRAVVTRDTRGLVKMVAERDTDRLLGVSILAPNAAEIIHVAALALRARMTINDLIDTLFVYPTLAESIKIAALAFRKDVSKLSCCAE
jgi:mercuric reductase